MQVRWPGTHSDHPIWALFRDNNCLSVIVHAFSAGSMKMALESKCLEELTRKRIVELRFFLDYDNDLSETPRIADQAYDEFKPV